MKLQNNRHYCQYPKLIYPQTSQGRKYPVVDHRGHQMDNLVGHDEEPVADDEIDVGLNRLVEVDCKNEDGIPSSNDNC